MIMKKSSVSRSIKWRRYLLTLLILIILAAGLIYKLRFSNADALWKIISQQCIPHMTTEDDPRPCAEVNIPAGFAVLKDRNGPLQYLLIPTVPISGIESPQLLTATSPNYFADAWQARYFMAEKYGAPIDDTDISLAINSQYGRTQDQLHIHISCLKPQVKPHWPPIAPISSNNGSCRLAAYWDTIIGYGASQQPNCNNQGRFIC